MMRPGVAIKLVEGNVAPRYGEGCELRLEGVTITEQGTKENLPMVDILMRGPGGKLFMLVLTGREVNAIAAVIKGVNTRNHGTPEP